MTMVVHEGRAEPAFRPLRCAVVTLSDSRGEADDRSGALIIERLLTAGHELTLRRLIRDDAEALRALVRVHQSAEEVEVMIYTGGTGITPRDITPDVLMEEGTKWLPGFGELFRWLSYQEIGASTIQSRAGAWLCDRLLTFALPGSTGAVRLAMDQIIIPQLDARTRPCNFAQLLPRVQGRERA